jgi:hypothetical protein
VPAVQDRAAVQRDQVALGEHLLGRRDAVHDLLVDRGADRRREAVVALERRDRAGVADDLLGDRVQVGRGDAGGDRVPHRVQRGGDDQAGAAHQLDLLGVFS